MSNKKLFKSDKLKDLRTKRHLTQQDAADKSGLNVNYYAKLERGLATPSLKTLIKLAKTFDVHSSELLFF